MMSGACLVLEESKCALVGGHTCEGSELGLGLAITGEVTEEDVLQKKGMNSGDLIILTKAIGTGKRNFYIALLGDYVSSLFFMTKSPGCWGFNYILLCL